MRKVWVNRSDLINQPHHNSQLTKSEATLFIESLLTKMADHLSARGRIEIRGFGTFTVRDHKPRWVENPRAGRYLMRPTNINFKPGKDLQAAVADQQIKEL